MTRSDTLRYPVFVVGMPRSGTTLISSMLDAHSQIAISPETHFYTRCHGISDRRERAVQEVWACLQQQPGIQDMALTDEEKNEIEHQLRDSEAPRRRDVLRAVEVTYAARYNAQAWGEKTPDHLVHVPTILRDFPGAVVLAIVRDPRDVCLSLRDMPWSRVSLPESAWKWRTYAQTTERYKHEYPNQFREVRYEDLLDDPERVIGSVLDWMGTSFEERVLGFHERGTGPADIDRETWKAKARRPIDPSNKEKWREQMRPGARFLVEAIAGAQMERKGYRFSDSSLGIRGMGGVLLEMGRALRTVAGRRWRKWKMPDRGPSDYTPVWIRYKSASSREEE